MTTDTRDDEALRLRLAAKLITRELARSEANPGQDVVRADLAADAVADTVVAVFDLPLSPFGLREMVRGTFTASGPRPSMASPQEHFYWYGKVQHEIATSLAGG